MMCYWKHYTAQKSKFSIKDFFSKFDQIRSFHFLCSAIGAPLEQQCGFSLR